MLGCSFNERKSMDSAMVRLPVVYSRDAIVDVEQLAAGLGVSVRIAEQMDLPSVLVGKRRRFLWGMVLDVLAERAA
jgi:hypothetical protein